MAKLKIFGSSAIAAGSVAVLAVTLAVLGLRGVGALESAELALYDLFVRLSPAERAVDQRILFVGITEDDIRTHGSWPLPDATLARAIEVLARHRPRAIGLDIYRDVPVPPGSDQLQAVLQRESLVVGVKKFGDSVSQGIGSHAALRTTNRVGFNDLLVDAGGTVRRGLLFLDDGVHAEYAFALRLALLYLEAEGIRALPDPSEATHLRLGATTIPPFDPNDGPYFRADDRGYQFMLDFKDARNTFPSVKLAQVLADTLDPSVIRDKVVLIGVTAESVKDHFYTPHSRAMLTDQQFAGVAIHVYIVRQLLRIALDGGKPMASVRRRETAAWIGVWSAAGAGVAFRVRSPWLLALALCAGLLVLSLAAYGAFLGQWWVPIVPPAAGWLASAGLLTAYVSYQQSAERTDLMRLFARSVSREIAEAIWAKREQFVQGGRPRSERVTITALFTDLVGFTTVSEKLGPEALMGWLNDYMEAMAAHVSQHGGVIRQYAGDSIVAVFGVPIPRRSEAELANDAANAVSCALSMGAALRELNRRWSAEGRPTTGMRVGIFTGPAVAGTLGSAERSEYVVVGDTMNIASRLESFDKDRFPPDAFQNPCRILVGATTHEYLNGRYATEPVGTVTLRGKEQAISVYRVLERAPDEIKHPSPGREDNETVPTT